MLLPTITERVQVSLEVKYPWKRVFVIVSVILQRLRVTLVRTFLSSSSEERFMGAKKSSSFSFCGMFKACFSSGSRDDYYYYDDSSRRIFASDEDRGRNWVGEPGIDKKASAFIARFYATRGTDSEQQIAS